MKNNSTLILKNVIVEGKKTSVRLEKEMWIAFKEIATIEGCTIHDLATLIKAKKKSESSLTASIRVFIMLYFKSSSTITGHKQAGHGSFERMQYRAGISIKNNIATKTASSIRS